MHGKRLIVQTEATVVRPAYLVQIPLQIHQLYLLLLNVFGQLGYLDLRFLLVLLILALHF